MSVFLCSLNSGSNANCYYIGTAEDAILIDAGLSCRETIRRMQQLDLSTDKIRGIFISHEHADHVSGLAGLSKKYKWPVYISQPTFSNCALPLDPFLVRTLSYHTALTIGNISVFPFSKSHDAADPCSFIISAYGINVGVITDIGHACKRVVRYFKECDAVFLESNYCDQMLTNGSYPWHLKQRISGNNGHLSNAQALELFRQHRTPRLRLLILSHLSKNNNKPELVEELFSKEAGTTRIVVASRYAASPVFSLEASQPIRTKPLEVSLPQQRQLSLF